jgi:MinD-like ATPase involved in chromosome partitioning or flagellar assembly
MPETYFMRNFMPRIVAVHSYRGGTGKSNLSANLAAAIALQGHRVAVIDTDLQSPGLHVLFGLTKDTIGKTLNDYLGGHCPIQDAAYSVSSLLRGKGELFLVPASIHTDDITQILSEGYDVSLLNDGCYQLIQDLSLDYLFIDTHPGLSKETFLLIAMSDLLLLILRPDSQDFQGTAVTVDILKQLKVRKMMLLLNHVLTRMNFTNLRKQVEKAYEIPIAGTFPLLEDVVQLGSRGIFCLEYPNHPFSREVSAVAEQILS